ncbi:MAG TPA: NAD(P)-dependent oxidoreductase [Pyrinomonadaceae bacterium]|nr:NAD(P)-dependent oxidoreductase [Pyrinomonadaceae bacterium]
MASQMNELVLGGEGLIGSELIRTLNAKGHRVVSLDLKSGCDLRQPLDLKPFEQCDRVWFLAWDTGGAKFLEAEDRQHEQYRNNCELSLRIFDALARTRKPFLFSTSQLAGLPNAYGTTKLMAWHWAAHLGGKVARMWNVYGWEHPDARSHVVTDLVLSGLRGRVKCMTNGEEKRLFLYKSDCVAALLALFDSPLQTAEIAGPRWLKIREVAEEIARQLKVDIELGKAKGSEVPIDPTELLPNWQPRVSLAEGIAQVISDAREYLSKNESVASAFLPK